MNIQNNKRLEYSSPMIELILLDKEISLILGVKVKFQAVFKSTSLKGQISG